MNVRAAILRIIGAGGTLLFACFFLLTFWRPLWVETFAAGFIKSEVESELHTRIDSFGGAGTSDVLAGAAATIYHKNQRQIERYKVDLKAHADRQIAACIARMLELDDGAREKIGRWLEATTLDGMLSLAAVNEQLNDVIQGSYLRVVGELQRDFRVFSASNCFCFLLLLLATFLRPEAVKALFVPALLLVAATLFCSYAYVFDQNWLLTVVYSDYLGFAYLGYLTLAFLFLCDVLLNRGRVTAQLAASLFGALPATTG
ncbi:MAG: hypothetical protein WDO72_09955 [Pseudomonadota bacterium]